LNLENRIRPLLSRPPHRADPHCRYVDERSTPVEHHPFGDRIFIENRVDDQICVVEHLQRPSLPLAWAVVRG